MKKSIVTISEDVMNSVVRPISCFINEIETGTTFSAVVMDGMNKVASKNGVFSKTTFTYASDKGGIYKFTLWDLKRFKYGDKAFLDFFVPKSGEPVSLADTFKVTACEPALTKDGDKMYPLFCYEGYEVYQQARTDLEAQKEQATSEAERASLRLEQSVYTTLFDSGIREGYDDKYYRTLQLDTPIIYYPE